jgi:DNA-binding MarR family transcriptional regulator
MDPADTDPAGIDPACMTSAGGRPDRFVDGYLLYLLARASSIASAGFHEELRSLGVPVPVWRVLASLKGTAGLTVGDLARRCLANQPAMSKTIEKLVAQGLVERRGDASDRRRTWVALTAPGEEQVDWLIARAEAHQARLVGTLGAEDAARLRKALTRVIETAEAEAQARDLAGAPA